MKNQYFGDIGDYGKYGLLRFLARHGVTVAVNWYLTPDDRSNDGNMRGYLGNEKDRVYDPELFDVLRDMCGRGEKDVRLFAARNMIGGAVFFDDPVRPLPSDAVSSAKDKRSARELWHRQALEACAGKELVFLDPDNGMRTGGPAARKDAPKFVYASEAAAYYERGQDVIYYCHRGRRTDAQWAKAKQMMREYCPGAALTGVTYHRGTQRSYIFVLHPEKEARYRGLVNEFLQTEWKQCFTQESIGNR